MVHDAQHTFAAHGVEVSGVKVDLAKMMAQKEKAVSGLCSGIEGLFKKNKVNYVKGWGKLTGNGKTVHVALNDGTTQTLTPKNVMLATGSEPASIPGVTIDEERIVSSTGALALKEIPKRMIVIGAGVIGLEMGSVWSRLGTQVEVVEFLPHIVPGLDSEVRRQFQRSLEKQALKFKLNTAVQKAEIKGGKTVELTVTDRKSNETSTLEADIVLVATGRKPYSSGLGLEDVGVKVNQRGQVEVDHHFQTNLPGVYAIGDLIPGPMLAHKAEEDGVACVELLAGKPGHVNYDTVPGIIYTHPEVATVGITEEQAKEQGKKVKVGKFSFMANSRARAVDTAEGMVKMLSCAETDKLLGVSIMGANAGELIHECVLTMEYGGTAEDLARTCHGHPTLSEAVKEAAMACAFGKPIHS
jgi:dihydrolipoamide dehydrogenase